MVNGVVSLRCPACERPFLSLSQQPGTMVTCPHCARSAVREDYPVATATANQPGASLPIQRRIQPRRPAMPTPQSSTSEPPPWPPAPEKAPLFSESSQPTFPPAPVAGPIWPPMMPSGHAPFQHVPAPSDGIESPQPTFGLGESIFMPAGVASPAPAPRPYVPSMDFAPREIPQDSRHTAADDYVAGPSWRPSREERNAPLGIFILLVLAVGGWMLWTYWEPPMAAEFQAPLASLKSEVQDHPPVGRSSLSPSAPPEVKPTPERMDLATATPVTVVDTPSPAPEPEIRRAEPAGGAPVIPVASVISRPSTSPALDLVQARAAAERLLEGVLAANTPAQRQSLVLHGEEHVADMTEFFTTVRPSIKRVKITEVLPLTLPGHEEVPLFRVETDKNAQRGALLRLVPQEQAGSFLLDWPLFQETHENKLLHFLENKPQEPSWFTVLLKRDHALSLPSAASEKQWSANLQASADGSVQCLAMTTRETPLGRYLEREVEWGNVYVARLLLQYRSLAEGTGTGVVILDCEGAVTGAAFPSGGLKR